MAKAVTEIGTVLTPIDGELAHLAALEAAGTLGSRDEVQGELDGIMAAMRRFHSQEPDQVLIEVMAYGARLTELYVLLHRSESLDRQYQRVRTQQVETIMKELDKQAKIASRLIEVRRQDLEMSR